MPAEAVELLSKTQPFSLLPLTVLEETASKLSLMRFPRGTVLACRAGPRSITCTSSAPAAWNFSSRVTAARRCKAALGPGDIFGAISILMNAGLSIRSLAVMEDAALYLMPKKAFLDLCDRYPSILDHFNRAFSQRMQNETYAATIAGSQVAHFLARIPPFSFLPEEDLRALAPHTSSVFFPKGAVVFVQGESRVDGLYIVQRGAAERYFEENRTKTLANVIGEGEMFGGISMLVNDMLAVRTLRTIEDTTFCKLAHEAFFDLCRRHEVFSEFFTDAFGKRMMDRTYSAIIAKSATPRSEPLALFSQPVSEVCTRVADDLQRRPADPAGRGNDEPPPLQQHFRPWGRRGHRRHRHRQRFAHESDRGGPQHRAAGGRDHVRAAENHSFGCPGVRGAHGHDAAGGQAPGRHGRPAAGRRGFDQPGRAGESEPVAAVSHPRYRRGAGRGGDRAGSSAAAAHRPDPDPGGNAGPAPESLHHRHFRCRSETAGRAGTEGHGAAAAKIRLHDSRQRRPQRSRR